MTAYCEAPADPAQQIGRVYMSQILFSRGE